MKLAISLDTTSPAFSHILRYLSATRLPLTKVVKQMLPSSTNTFFKKIGSVFHRAPLEGFRYASTSADIVLKSHLWKEHFPNTTRIYHNANELLRPIEHLAKLGNSRTEFIVLHPVNASRNAFDQVTGRVIVVDA